MGFKNVFACLVHESQDCIIDLIHNLRSRDPDSLVLLYNGGVAGDLLDDFPFDRYGVEVHPNPRRMTWGRLHWYALDCMEFCTENFNFDTLTIVDSDQLLLRAGYSKFMKDSLDDMSNIGMLCSSLAPLDKNTINGPCRAAFDEIDLWLPLLKRFPDGEDKFFHWTFWPSTVFLAPAVRDLLKIARADHTIQEILATSQIWASEEVIFPTLVALLGYEIGQNPCSFDYVKYGAAYSLRQIEAALIQPDVFWVHPVPRDYGDEVRNRIRQELAPDLKLRCERPSLGQLPNGLLGPIWERANAIDGWLDENEAELLLESCSSALRSISQPWDCVEIGSYHGKSTVLLGNLLRSHGTSAVLYAVDPHEGRVGSSDRGIQLLNPSLDALINNIRSLELENVIRVLVNQACKLTWESPVGFVFIDGIHDYPSVARDFFKFDPWIIPGGVIAFHDYSDFYPGVKMFVDELVLNGAYEPVASAGSLMVCKKVRVSAADYRRRSLSANSDKSVLVASSSSIIEGEPFVSCIMPTRNRPDFVRLAVDNFMRQDYGKRELIIVDDGDEPLSHLMPDCGFVRYYRPTACETIGAKRNFACEKASGEIVVHWDDDDWSASWRISCQVMELLRSQSQVCGLSRVLFYDALHETFWEYMYPESESAWVCGGTLCYRKSFWKCFPFRSISEGEDNAFLEHASADQIHRVQTSDFYVGTIHAGNTSPKCTAHPWWRQMSGDAVNYDYKEYKNQVDKVVWANRSGERKF
ncbi:MAG TPA: class I SAM-dependent methyltransferase [Candidatus Acidoferrum sp.]|nr:class I SAM-dependent methyltransferase [Candidatus Acidoferrum sp.]